MNRILRAGNKWGIVKSNKSNSIQVWGDVMGEVSFYLLPTYSLLD